MEAFEPNSTDIIGDRVNGVNGKLFNHVVEDDNSRNEEVQAVEGSSRM